MIPKPWSPSGLESFIDCPRAFYEKKVAKSVVEPVTIQQKEGLYAHGCFEAWQKTREKLPYELLPHLPFLQRLADLPGTTETEQKVALNFRGDPCGFFDKQVWFRGIMDYRKCHGPHALVVDYKTGKEHRKFGQLKIYALYTFAQRPEIHTVAVKFYWTKTKKVTGEVYTRDMISALWQEFIPNLRQYMTAFKTETWQPRPSGLCHGWCPVTQCEFHKPPRSPRY